MILKKFLYSSFTQKASQLLSVDVGIQRSKSNQLKSVTIIDQTSHVLLWFWIVNRTHRVKINFFPLESVSILIFKWRHLLITFLYKYYVFVQNSRHFSNICFCLVVVCSTCSLLIIVILVILLLLSHHNNK